MPRTPTPAPRAPLSRELILRTAIELVDEQGTGALTMRRLGAELGVEAMSLYNHVANKQEVLDGMAGLLIAQMFDDQCTSSPTAGRSDWQDEIRRVCSDYRSTITAHPHVFSSTGGRPLTGPDDAAAFGRLMALLQEAGFDEASATDLFQVGANYARGFAMAHITRAGDTTNLPTAWNSDRAFDRGLEMVIAGFSSLIDNRGG